MKFLVTKFSLSLIYITVVELYQNFFSSTPALHCVNDIGVRPAYFWVSWDLVPNS